MLTPRAFQDLGCRPTLAALTISVLALAGCGGTTAHKPATPAPPSHTATKPERSTTTEHPLERVLDCGSITVVTNVGDSRAGVSSIPDWRHAPLVRAAASRFMS